MLMPLLNAVGITGDSVYLSPAPLYHTAPSFWSMVVQSLGGTTVVMEKFDPEAALECIQRYGITHGQFVPAMFVRMLKLPEAVRKSYDVSSLQRVVHAAAPCPVEIKKQMIEWWGPIIDEYYASSEGGGSLVHPRRGLAGPPRLGRPTPGRGPAHPRRERPGATARRSPARSITRVDIPSSTSRTTRRRRRPMTRTAG